MKHGHMEETRFVRVPATEYSMMVTNESSYKSAEANKEDFGEITMNTMMKQ